MDKKEFMFGGSKPTMSWSDYQLLVEAHEKSNTNFIIMMVFVGILALAICGGLGMYIAGEKGRSTIKGFCIGLIPFFGHIYLAFMSPSDENIVDEMFQRKLITLDEYNKTTEVLVAKTQEMQVQKDSKKSALN